MLCAAVVTCAVGVADALLLLLLLHLLFLLLLLPFTGAPNIHSLVIFSRIAPPPQLKELRTPARPRRMQGALGSAVTSNLCCRASRKNSSSSFA